MKQSTLSEYQSSDVECPECGDVFDSEHGLNSHHGQIHGGPVSDNIVNCSHCGNSFEKNPTHIKKHDRHFCSLDCQSKGRKGESPTNKDREQRQCDFCGADFEVTKKSEQRFCGRDCYHAWRKESGVLTGENNPNYKQPIELVCEWCECDYEVPPVHEDSRFCCSECKHEWFSTRTGKDHPLWQGGTDWYTSIRQELGPTGWHTLRKEHLGENCEMCGTDTSPNDRDLSLHHIVPILSGGTNGAYNFMTLCEPCHSKVECYCSDLAGFDTFLVE